MGLSLMGLRMASRTSGAKLLNTYESSQLPGYLYKRYCNVMIRAAREAIGNAIPVGPPLANIIAGYGMFTLDEHFSEVWKTQILQEWYFDQWSNNSFTVHIFPSMGEWIPMELEIHNSAIAPMLPADDRCAKFKCNRKLFGDMNCIIDLFPWNFAKRQKPRMLFCHEFLGRLLIAAYTDKAQRLLDVLNL